MTTRCVPSGLPASELTRTGLRSGKYWTSPACAARTTYPIVAAFLKLGMPTMMSARPRRAISSRMAGVSADGGIASTLPPGDSRSYGCAEAAAGRGGVPRVARSARRDGFRDPLGRVGRAGDGPVGLLAPGEVA